jgi:hypothetical protein
MVERGRAEGCAGGLTRLSSGSAAEFAALHADLVKNGQTAATLQVPAAHLILCDH